MLLGRLPTWAHDRARTRSHVGVHSGRARRGTLLGAHTRRTRGGGWGGLLRIGGADSEQDLAAHSRGMHSCRALCVRVLGSRVGSANVDGRGGEHRYESAGRTYDRRSHSGTLVARRLLALRDRGGHVRAGFRMAAPWKLRCRSVALQGLDFTTTVREHVCVVARSRRFGPFHLRTWSGKQPSVGLKPTALPNRPMALRASQELHVCTSRCRAPFFRTSSRPPASSQALRCGRASR